MPKPCCLGQNSFSFLIQSSRGRRSMPCSLGAPKKAYVPWSFHNSLKSRIKTFFPATQASDMIREKGSAASKGTLFPPSQPPKDLVSSCPLFGLIMLFQLSAPLFTPGQAYLGLVLDTIHERSVRSVCAEYNKQPSYLPRLFFFFFFIHRIQSTVLFRQSTDFELHCQRTA